MICFGRLFEFGIGATKSPEGERMKIFANNWKFLRFSASNNIDFWYRQIHMAEQYFSKIKRSILLKHEQKSPMIYRNTMTKCFELRLPVYCRPLVNVNGAVTEKCELVRTAPVQDAAGKPSTWFPPGRLVELLIANIFCSCDYLRHFSFLKCLEKSQHFNIRKE